MLISQFIKILDKYPCDIYVGVQDDVCSSSLIRISGFEYIHEHHNIDLNYSSDNALSKNEIISQLQKLLIEHGDLIVGLHFEYGGYEWFRPIAEIEEVKIWTDSVQYSYLEIIL